jgi:hypothetical protein
MCAPAAALLASFAMAMAMPAAAGAAAPRETAAPPGTDAPLVMHVRVEGPAGPQATTFEIPATAHVGHVQNGPAYRVHFAARRVDACHVVVADLRYAPRDADLAPLKAVLPPRRLRAGQTLTSTSSDSLRVDLRLDGPQACASAADPPELAAPESRTVTGTCLGLSPVALADARRSEHVQETWDLAAAAEGVAVWSVAPRSPAALAGLRTGDVIATFNGEPVRLPSDLTVRVSALAPGDRFQLVVHRGGETSTLEGVLGERVAAEAAMQCRAPTAPPTADEAAR